MPRAKRTRQTDAGDADHYAGVLEDKEFKLTRVTTIINKVTGDAKTGMSYWGSQNAIRYVVDALEDFDLSFSPDYDEMYAAYKTSPFDNNKTSKRRADEGKRAHKLFEHLLKGTATVKAPGYMGDGVWVAAPLVTDGDGPPFIPVKWDLAVVKAYVEIFMHLKPDEIESESRVRWFEPGHPFECPDAVCTHGFAGTSDYILKTLLVGGDLKTHKGDGRYGDFLQNGFYGVARKQMDGTDINRHMVLLAAEDGTYTDEYGFVGEGPVLATWEIYKDMVRHEREAKEARKT